MALIDLCIIRCLDRFYFIIDYCYFEVAAYTAIGAYGAYLFIGRDRLGFEYI